MGISQLLGMYEGPALVLLTIFGWTREIWQHDLRLSNWQLLEAGAWPLGGLLVLPLL